MKRLLPVLILMFILTSSQAWAFTSQYPNPYRQTIWNNITDGVHTFGQNTQQTQATLKKLHNARTRARLTSINRAVSAKRRAQIQAWQNSQNQ